MKNTAPVILFAIFFWISPAQALAANYSGKLGYLVKNAEAYTKQGNHMMAMMMYDQAIRMQPGDLDLHYKRAASYGHAGYYLNAIKDLSLVINGDEAFGKPKYASARKFRAECYAMLGYYDKAIADYKIMTEAKENTIKIAKVWYYLAELYAHMNKKDLAMAAINKGLVLNSHWSTKLNELKFKIISGQTIKLHKPFTN